MYQALYRKWRPRTFDDVVGQAHITDTLKRQVAAGRLSHAYLFTGTRGTGKTTCAKILARAVNCEHPVDGNPCNTCPACQGIENGSILDVLELDAASNNGVDQVRALRDEAVYTPAAVRKRVYIVDEVHMLSTAAFNALLKILEEPPAHLMFILATTELHKVPATIKSRCQQFAFKRILPGDIARRLAYVAEQEGIELTAEGAALLSRLADGGLRDALSLLDQCVGSGGAIGEREVLDALGLAGNLETAALMEQIGTGDTAGALETLARLYGAGKEVGSLLGELSSLARDLLVRKTAPKGGAALLTGGYDEAALRRLSNLFSPQRLVQALGLLQSTQAELSRSGNRRTDAELCLIRLCDETLDASLAGINARLTRLENLSASGGLSGTQATPPPRNQRQIQTPPSPAPVPSPPDPEDTPPWEEERPPLPEEPGERVTPEPPCGQETPQPPPSPRQETPLNPAEPLPEKLWPSLVAALRGNIPMSAFALINNPAMIQGRLTDNRLTLWATSEFERSAVGKPGILEMVARTASAMLGRPVTCTITVGHPSAQAQAGVHVQAAVRPESGTGSETGTRVQAGPQENDHDNLDDLLALGAQLGGIVVEESLPNQ